MSTFLDLLNRAKLLFVHSLLPPDNNYKPKKEVAPGNILAST
jgi:hypothetical protein